MSLTDFGPVETTHYNPGYSLSSSQNKGVASVQITGSMALADAQTLFELVNNPDGRTTVQGHTGVLEVITSPYPVISPFNGLYIFEDFTYTPYKFDADTIAADFTLTAAFVGQQ